MLTYQTSLTSIIPFPTTNPQAQINNATTWINQVRQICKEPEILCKLEASLPNRIRDAKTWTFGDVPLGKTKEKFRNQSEYGLLVSDESVPVLI